MGRTGTGHGTLDLVRRVVVRAGSTWTAGRGCTSAGAVTGQTRTSVATKGPLTAVIAGQVRGDTGSVASGVGTRLVGASLVCTGRVVRLRGQSGIPQRMMPLTPVAESSWPPPRAFLTVSTIWPRQPVKRDRSRKGTYTHDVCCYSIKWMMNKRAERLPAYIHLAIALV